MTRLLYVVTHPVSARLLLAGQLSWMRRQGYDVAVAAANGPDLEEVARTQQVEVFEVPFQREMAPLADLRALATLHSVMGRWRPDIVNASTPKAGLLGMMAAWARRVPVRIYVQRGLRLETTTGLKREILKVAERAACAAATRVVAISRSLAAKCVDIGLVPAHKLVVLGNGSSNGIDAARFAAFDLETAGCIRRKLGLRPDDLVIGFVGRLTRDKGVEDLVRAYDKVVNDIPNAKLLLIGGFETGDPVSRQIRERMETGHGIILAGPVADPAPYFALMSVFAFPSLREGFGNVALEAAAAGLPVVGVKATGSVDAIVDGVTGTLVAPRDPGALAGAVTRYLSDQVLSLQHGRAGQQRVGRDFSPELIWQELDREYRAGLGAMGTGFAAGPSGVSRYE